jgi:uncharacterized surface protein with fasciclin (FAS1) repeats
MRRAATAGFAAGVAMMIGGALGAVSNSYTESKPLLDTGVINPMVGGQAMLPQRDIMDNLAASPMHTRMAQALKETGMVSALKSSGEFTVFAPTDAAFAQAGHMSQADLARRMSYLIVPGAYDSTTLLRMINEKGGDVRLRTAEGGVLIARMNGPTNILLMDENGNMADIAIYDIHDKNGVIQVIDKVLAPTSPAHRVASNTGVDG